MSEVLFLVKIVYVKTSVRNENNADDIFNKFIFIILFMITHIQLIGIKSCRQDKV